MIGKLVEEIFDKVGIICNKNIILFDKEKLFVISGVRLGILVVIICGFDEFVFVEVVKIISLVLNNYDNDIKLNEVKERVYVFIFKYLLYN